MKRETHQVCDCKRTFQEQGNGWRSSVEQEEQVKEDRGGKVCEGGKA